MSRKLRRNKPKSGSYSQAGASPALPIAKNKPEPADVRKAVGLAVFEGVLRWFPGFLHKCEALPVSGSGAALFDNNNTEKLDAIRQPGDVSRMVYAWGRHGMNGAPFAKFKQNVKVAASRRGPEFVKALPAGWQDELEREADAFQKYSGLPAQVRRYCTITKSETDADGYLVVTGVATTEDPDTQAGTWDGKQYAGDIILASAVEAALPEYMTWGTLREMHEPSAIGVVTDAHVVYDRVTLPDGTDVTNPTFITTRIIDAEAREKFEQGVYKGFSLGGGITSAQVKEIDGKMYRVSDGITITEISGVDRPANSGSRVIDVQPEGA